MSKYQGYEEFKENRALSGVGAGLYVKDSVDHKYVLALLLETVPSVAGSYNTIEVDVTGSNVIGKILGKQTIDDKDTNFLMHRDNILRIEELSNQVLEYMVVTPDMMGFGFTGTLTYKPDDMSSNDSAKGTLTITALSIDEKPTINVLPLLKKTVKFVNPIPYKVEMEASGTLDIPVELDSSSATCTIESDTSTITGTYDTSNKKVKLTSTSAEGSAIIKIKATETGKASWTTTVLVIIK